MPGTNGTIGFHSPEQESSEFDGRTDVWALGVCFFRAMYNRLPWFISRSGNPWNRKNPHRVQEQRRFHEKYTEAISQIQDDKHAGRGGYTTYLVPSRLIHVSCT
jgi:serine/threonine protein kinase